MSPIPQPGDRVTWWWTADNCRCPANGHQDHDANKHPMADGRELPVMTECKHHRTLTGYTAVVVGAHRESDQSGGCRTTRPGRVICDLEVALPAHIGPGSRHNLVPRQAHAVLAEGSARPRSGWCTAGSIEDEMARHAGRLGA